MPSRLETVLRAGQQRRQSKPVGVVLWDPPPGLYATSTARNPNWVDPDPPPPEPELGRPRSTTTRARAGSTQIHTTTRARAGRQPVPAAARNQVGLGKRRGGRAPRERANDGRVAHPIDPDDVAADPVALGVPGRCTGWVLFAGAGWPPDSMTIYSPPRACLSRCRGGPGLRLRCVARQPGATTTLKPTSTLKRAVYHA